MTTDTVFDGYIRADALRGGELLVIPAHDLGREGEDLPMRVARCLEDGAVIRVAGFILGKPVKVVLAKTRSVELYTFDE